jgi:hypothetical protein
MALAGTAFAIHFTLCLFQLILPVGSISSFSDNPSAVLFHYGIIDDWFLYNAIL